MKTRITFLILSALLLCAPLGYGQQDEECMVNLTLFTDLYKNKELDKAYEPWMKVRNKCPKFNYAIYAYGEKILKHKIEHSTGAEQKAFIDDLNKLWDQGLEHFSNKYTTGGVLTDKCLLLYDNKELLAASDKQIYDACDQIFQQDPDNFTHPKALYIYFSSMVDMHRSGQAPLQDVFNKYDDVTGLIETQIGKSTEALNTLLAKEEAGTLTSKDEKYRKYYTSVLENYEKIGGSIDSKLGELANCQNLIPLYNKDFEANKNNAEWLKRAVSRMYNKECTDDPLYVKLVKAYDATEPSADTKYFVATVLLKQNKLSEAMSYMKQSYDLQTDTYKKGKLAEKIGQALKKGGRYSEARNYYQESLKLNPSNGKPHLNIAAMYAASAPSCGGDSFDKRAVFWKAADEARKAGRVDPTLKSIAAQTAANYDAKAPTKSEIFTKGNSGQSISIKCWVGGSVTVPKL